MSSPTDNQKSVLPDTNMNCPKGDGVQLSTAALCPHIESRDIIVQLLKINYGFEVIRLKELNGYDDLNFHVLVSPDHSNPQVGEVSPNGYFLKISNLRDSQMPEFLYAQLAVMEHLLKKGILCQAPIKSVTGEAFTECTAANKDGVNVIYMASLRTYLPGTILAEVILTPKLLYDLGHYVAKVTKSLEDFHCPFYDTFDCPWSMNTIPNLEGILFTVKDDNMRRISAEVIQKFISEVEPNKHRFRTGQIHGDLNEQNILVTVESSPDSSPQICGLIDFQDSQNSFPIYDLALIVAYMLMTKYSEVPVLDVPGHILAGYTSILDLNTTEETLFKTLVAGRMVQSLVMGAYTYSLDPANQYVLTTAQCGWKSLETFWEAGEAQAQQRWNEIVKSYKHL